MNANHIDGMSGQEFLEKEVELLKKELAEAHATCENMKIYYQRENEMQEALIISEKKLEIFMGFSDVSVFEYNIKTKRMVTQHTDFEIFGMPAVLENGVEEVISTGIIAKRSVTDFREMYDKINSGEPSAKSVIYALDINGSEHILEIQLMTIYNKKGEPICAIGARKDITDSLLLQKEKEYGDILTFGRMLVYEANVTQNRIICYDPQWVEETGITDTRTFSGMIESFCHASLAPDDVNTITAQLSKEMITKDFEDEHQVISCEYRRKLGLGLGKEEAYYWFEKSINIIKDDLTGDINIRCYEANIEKKKQKEWQAMAEQKHYEMMISKSETVYEINITKNLSISGHENWAELFGIESTDNYSKMIAELAQKTIHPKDGAGFVSTFSVDHVLEKFRQGKSQIMYEYRRPDETKELIWVRCTMHLFEDLKTGDIRGFSYVEKIDEEKKKQLKLMYRAQHDMLTGFYTKADIEERIEEFFATNEGKVGKHVFFIIDIDYFKLINDNFGHAFGDAVLSQTASKIEVLFREDDLLGRIGGDEFVVLMKNIQNERAGILKAKEICECVSQDYLKDQVSYRISVSIGIAYYKNDGRNYKELYRNSDTALYQAKEHGRNRFSVYQKEMSLNASVVKDIEYSSVLEVKNFKKNVSESVFDLLCESGNKQEGIQSALELIGKHYNASRTYIFEDSADGRSTSNTFEWCNRGIKSQKDNLQNLNYEDLSDYKKNFDKDGMFFMPDTRKITNTVKGMLEAQGVNSMLQVALFQNNEFYGFVGFDEVNYMKVPSQSEILDYRNVAKMLGVFLLQMRTAEKYEAEKKELLSMIHGSGW